MHLAFVTPRFLAEDACRSERLAAALAKRASGRWRVTVLTTTAGKSSGGPFEVGQVQDERARIHRFAEAPETASGEGVRAPPDALTSSPLLNHLRERQADYDLIVVFGSRFALCREAARIEPERTVLVPFADEGGLDAAARAKVFDQLAGFLFESEAEEVEVLDRYGVHRRMRETIGGSLLLPRSADAAAFRQLSGLDSPYLIHTGPLEPGRGLEEFVRYFATFRERHSDASLDLVLIGSSLSIRIPGRSDIRVLDLPEAQQRLDAVAGALMAVIPERLAGSAAAAEPFSLGTPILANASAVELVRHCNASSGGLYYQGYEEFELILEIALGEPSLIGRMGEAGRAFLESENDWDALIARYDRAFRSFTRPSRAGQHQQPAAPRLAAEPPPEESAAAAEGVEPQGPVPAADAAPGSPELADADSENADSGSAPETGLLPVERGGSAAPGSPADEETVARETEAVAPASDPDPKQASLPNFFQGSLRD